ncbi:MAG: DUF3791 domain-containing protein [Lachnospiraceae bacterium]|nr:DUF3791 domain-containing protein [Lachnospiraceae bacterium]
MSDKNQNELEFIIFCIENVGQKLSMTGDKVYELLSKKSHILEDYIRPNFEILHTQSKEYIIEDIIEYMKAEGVV